MFGGERELISGPLNNKKDRDTTLTVREELRKVVGRGCGTGGCAVLGTFFTVY